MNLVDIDREGRARINFDALRQLAHGDSLKHQLLRRTGRTTWLLIRALYVVMHGCHGVRYVVPHRSHYLAEQVMWILSQWPGLDPTGVKIFLGPDAWLHVAFAHTDAELIICTPPSPGRWRGLRPCYAAIDHSLFGNIGPNGEPIDWDAFEEAYRAWKQIDDHAVTHACLEVFSPRLGRKS